MDSTIVSATIGAIATIAGPIVAYWMIETIKGRREKIKNERAKPPGTNGPENERRPSGETDGENLVTIVDTGRIEPLPSQPPRITIYGKVVGKIGKELGIRVENEAEMLEFWRVNNIGTNIYWAGKPPLVSIGRRDDIARCKLGDRAYITLEVQDRSNGKRGTKTVDFEIRSRGA